MTNYSTAVISECGRYRYELIRRWGDDPMIEFVMLNPSTADASIDDPTIRRCLGFAKQWGYGAIVVRNLFALRATNPAELLTAEDPFGPKNQNYLDNNIAECTIAAWGANPAAAQWWKEHSFSRRLMFCLGRTASGAPKHPLYLPKTVSSTPWRPEMINA